MGHVPGKILYIIIGRKYIIITCKTFKQLYVIAVGTTVYLLHVVILQICIFPPPDLTCILHDSNDQCRLNGSATFSTYLSLSNICEFDVRISFWNFTRASCCYVNNNNLYRRTHDVGSAVLGRVSDVEANASVREHGLRGKEIYRQLRNEPVEPVNAARIRGTCAHADEKTAEKKAVRFDIFRPKHEYRFHQAHGRLFAQESWNDTQRRRGLNHVTVNQWQLCKREVKLGDRLSLEFLIVIYGV